MEARQPAEGVKPIRDALYTKTGGTFNWAWAVPEKQRNAALAAVDALASALQAVERERDAALAKREADLDGLNTQAELTGIARAERDAAEARLLAVEEALRDADTFVGQAKAKIEGQTKDFTEGDFQELLGVLSAARSVLRLASVERGTG